MRNKQGLDPKLQQLFSTIIFSIATALSLLHPHPAYAQKSEVPACVEQYETQKVFSHSEATASTFSNLFWTETSLRSVIENGLQTGLQHLQSRSCCIKDCGNECEVFLRLEATPKHLQEAQKDSQCEKLLRETSRYPLTYHPEEFSDLDEFREWFEDFAQGDNPAGEKLHQSCPAACSARYSAVLTPVSAGFKVKALAKCGPPRVEGEGGDIYRVAVWTTWRCGASGG